MGCRGTDEYHPMVERINYVHHAGNASGIVVDGGGAELVLIGRNRRQRTRLQKLRAPIISVALAAFRSTIMLTVARRHQQPRESAQPGIKTPQTREDIVCPKVVKRSPPEYAALR